MDGTVLMAAIRDIGDQLKQSLRRQLQLARGPCSTQLAAGGPAVCVLEFLDQGSAVASTAAKGQTADDQVPNRSRNCTGLCVCHMIITILFFSKYFL